MDTQLEHADLHESSLPSGKDQPDNELHYRSVSKSGAAGAILAGLGLMYLLSSVLIVLPLAGLALSLIGLSNIRRLPDELTGRSLARIGLGLSAAVLIGGTSWHAFIYMTEVPEGYDRISFRMLKDNEKTALPWGEQAEELDGKKVFLKGWVRPGNRKNNLKDFILVGDLGSCCFGGSPKITDVVAISIQGDERISYSWRMRKIAGTFRLNRRAVRTREKDVPRVFYQIDADIVK